MTTYTNDLRVWQNGTWAYPSEINVADGAGNWAHASHVYVRKGNAWVQSWPRIEGNVQAFVPEWVITATVGSSTRVYYANLTDNKWTYVTIPNFESSDTVHNVKNLSNNSTWGTIIAGGDSASGELIYLGNYPNTLLATAPTAPTVYPGYDYANAVKTFHAWDQSIFGDVTLNVGFATGKEITISSVYSGQQVQFYNTGSTAEILPQAAAYNGCTPYTFHENNVANYVVFVGDSGRILTNINLGGTPPAYVQDAFNRVWFYFQVSAFSATNFTGTMSDFGGSRHYVCGTGGVLGYLTDDGGWTVQRQGDYATGSNYSDNINKMIWFDAPSYGATWTYDGYTVVSGVAVGDSGFFSILNRPTSTDRWNKRTIYDNVGNPITANITGVIQNVKNAGTLDAKLELVLLTDTGTVYKNIDGTLTTYVSYTHADVDSWVAGDNF